MVDIGGDTRAKLEMFQLGPGSTPGRGGPQLGRGDSGKAALGPSPPQHRRVPLHTTRQRASGHESGL